MNTFTKRYLRYVGFVGLLILAFGIFLAGYKYRFSMEEATPREIHNPAEYSTHVLIATQGSEFKDAVLDKMLFELEHLEYYIKVIDIKHLKNIKIKDWHAIALIHTWEMWEEPKPIANFLDKNLDRTKIITLTTSGDSGAQRDDIDGITSASAMTNVDAVSKELINKIGAVISNSPMAP